MLWINVLMTLTGDVTRVDQYQKSHKKDWYLTMDARDLIMVKKMNRDLFTITADAVGPTGLVEPKTMLDPTMDRQEIFNRLKAAKRI